MTRMPRRLVLILGALTAFGPMSIDLYLPSLPALERALATDAGAVQLTLAAFFIGLALGQMLYGPLTDHYGRKRPLYVGLVVYVLASVGAAFAPNVETLIGLRFVQAIGGCAGIVIARTIVRDLLDAQDSARVFSLLMLVMGLAPVLAPLLGGYLLIWWGWQSIFLALAAFGLACLIAVATVLPETRERQPRGTPLEFATALRSYRLLLRDRHFVGYALSSGLAFGALFAYLAASPFLFITLHGVPPESFGWLFGINALGLIAASQLNRRLLHRWSADTLLAAALAAAAVLGVALFAATALGIGGFPGLLLPLFGVIASLGFTQPNAVACALAKHGERAGSASALFGTLQFSIGSIAGMLVGALHDGTALPMAGVIAGSGLAALVIQRWLIRRPHDTRQRCPSSG